LCRSRGPRRRGRRRLRRSWTSTTGWITRTWCVPFPPLLSFNQSSTSSADQLSLPTPSYLSPSLFFPQIGDLPTRFHYTKTAPQAYGLTPAEILLATDAELNAFLGVKQYAAFRPDGGAGAGRVGRDKRLWELKKKLKGRKWGEAAAEEVEAEGKGKKKFFGATGANGEKVEKKKRVGKKERLRAQAAAKAAGGGAGGEGGVGEPDLAAIARAAEEGGSAKKKRKIAKE
jgi:protein KRI1